MGNIYSVSRKRKTIKKTAVTIAVLLLLCLIGGTVYVYLSDRSPAKPAKAPKATTTVVSAAPKPVQPAANAQEGVAIESLISPVAVGANTSMVVNTNAGSTCSILVTYNGVPSKDSGLASKAADAYGTVSWTWTVGSSTPVGSWPVQVTCVRNGKSGVVDTNLQVTKPA